MNDEHDLWLAAMAEMEARRQKGLHEYGRPVTADATIDWLQHAESEFWDGAIYCRAAREVMRGLQGRIAQLEGELTAARERIRELEGK